MSRKWNLLYVYAKRHPKDLIELVYNSIPKEEFNVNMVHYDQPVNDICELINKADAVLLAPARKLPEGAFQCAKNVKLMQIWSAGFDKFNVDLATHYNIPVANNGGANKIAVAEHTILLMLAVYKKLPESHMRTISGNWSGNSHGMDMFMLYNKTIGIIGMGNIGKEVAKRVSAFNTNILYYDIARADNEFEKIINGEFVDLETLLKKSDIVTLHLHLNEATHRMLGDKEISLMKKSAIIINVSRAELINNEALTKALYDNRIWGAGFDVYEEEPTKPNDPLLNHPNIVATPHMAHSYDSHKMVIGACMSNLLRVKKGKEPLWRVN